MGRPDQFTRAGGGCHETGDTVVFAMSSVFMTPTAFTKAWIARAPSRGKRGNRHNIQQCPRARDDRAAHVRVDGNEHVSRSTAGDRSAVDDDPEVGLSPRSNPHFIGTMQGAQFRAGIHSSVYSGRCRDLRSHSTEPARVRQFRARPLHQRTSTRNAKIKVAEIHEGLPVIPGGDNWMHIDEFDFLIQGERLTIPSPIVAPKEQTVEPKSCAGTTWPTSSTMATR